ncbi:DnaJ-like protein subfamily C member 9 [Nematocida sp. AWRm77]|nr:DnaJ-like protein subfamily C member 9 [Nematocida sp. AWRm77]
MDSNMSAEEAAKLLGVSLSSSEEEVKSAFKRLAMKRHPDRPGGTKEDFIKLSEAYDVLKKREGKQPITKSMFDQFRDVYQGSSEEKEELVSLYTKHRGNMAKVVDSMLLGEDEEESRYRAILGKEIEAGRVKEYPAYKKLLMKNTRRQKKREKEAREAEDLSKMLEQNRAARENRWAEMMERLEAKAEKKPRSSKKTQKTQKTQKSLP